MGNAFEYFSYKVQDLNFSLNLFYIFIIFILNFLKTF